MRLAERRSINTYLHGFYEGIVLKASYRESLQINRIHRKVFTSGS